MAAVETTPERARLASRVETLEAELRRAESQVEAMKRIGRALGASTEIDALLPEIMTCTTELLDVDRSTLFLVDPSGEELWSKVLEGGDLKEIRMKVGAGIAGWVAKTGEPLLIPDAYADERFNPAFDKASGYRTRDILTWPVKRPAHGALIGVIQVLNKRHGRFQSADELLLEAIASELGVGLEVWTLYREAVERTAALEKARSELELLFETERALSFSDNLAEMLGTILETALTTMGASSGAVHLLDDRGVRLETLAARGAGSDAIMEEGVRIGLGVVGAAVKTNEPICVNGVEGMVRGTEKVRSVLAVPIRNRYDGVLGALELMNAPEQAGFTDSDVKTLGIVATQAGRAIAAQRRRLERAQEERLSAIGRMLSGVLHDFRTPMTLISGYTQVMADAEGSDERSRYAELVERQIALLTGMTKELLAFARGERSIYLRKVQMHVFMDEMREHLGRELDGTGVALEVRVNYRGPAWFDEIKLRRVFHNLVRNAREAMPEGGHFWVSVDATDESLRLAFEDDGPGIPDELEHSLFEPFATAGKVGGTGLGLAMARQIAEEHGGSIEVESREGGGARFVVMLPLAAPQR